MRVDLDTSQQQCAERRERVLLIPGIDGDPRLPLASRAVALSRPASPAVRSPVRRGRRWPEGLVRRALLILDADDERTAPAYVCGESFGGTVALTLAKRYPERIHGLILLSTFGWYPVIATRFALLGMRVWRLLGDRIASRVFSAWRAFSVPGALGLRCSRELVRPYLDRPPLHLPGYRAKCTIALSSDTRSWLGEITCPAFVLVGMRDPVVLTQAGRELARLVPNASLHVLDGGHLVHIVRAAEARALIARWMTHHRPSTAERCSA